MRSRSTTVIVAVCTVIIYGTLALVSVPLHFHGDGMLTSGSGVSTLAPHADAGHCGHTPADIHHDDCTLCSAAVPDRIVHSSHSVIFPAPVTAITLVAPFRHSFHPFYSVLSRRGPPAGIS